MITNQRRAGFVVRIGSFTLFLGALAVAGCSGGDRQRAEEQRERTDPDHETRAPLISNHG